MIVHLFRYAGNVSSLVVFDALVEGCPTKAMQKEAFREQALLRVALASEGNVARVVPSSLPILSAKRAASAFQSCIVGETDLSVAWQAKFHAMAARVRAAAKDLRVRTPRPEIVRICSLVLVPLIHRQQFVTTALQLADLLSGDEHTNTVGCVCWSFSALDGDAAMTEEEANMAVLTRASSTGTDVAEPDPLAFAQSRDRRGSSNAAGNTDSSKPQFHFLIDETWNSLRERLSLYRPLDSESAQSRGPHDTPPNIVKQLVADLTKVCTPVLSRAGNANAWNSTAGVAHNSGPSFDVASETVRTAFDDAISNIRFWQARQRKAEIDVDDRKEQLSHALWFGNIWKLRAVGFSLH